MIQMGKYYIENCLINFVIDFQATEQLLKFKASNEVPDFRVTIQFLEGTLFSMEHDLDSKLFLVWFAQFLLQHKQRPLRVGLGC